MTYYYALWIPTLKVGKVALIAPQGMRRIQDNAIWDPYFLWGEVNDACSDFTLLYSTKDDRTKAKHLKFCHQEHNNHGFIIYSVELPNEDTEDALLNVLRDRGLIPSIYHYIKDFFHKHVHHDSNEDALLKCLCSSMPLTLETEDGKRVIYNFYLDLYAKKIANFLNDAIEYHKRGRELVNNVLTAAKGIELFAYTIKCGRNLIGEYEYCEFLMKHYTVGRAHQNKKIRDDMDAIRRELETFSSDYQLCTNAYSIKLAVYGIFAGVAGILVSTVGIILTCCSGTDITPIIEHLEHVSNKQDVEYQRGDKMLRDLNERLDSLQLEMKEVNSRIEGATEKR